MSDDPKSAGGPKSAHGPDNPFAALPWATPEAMAAFERISKELARAAAASQTAMAGMVERAGQESAPGFDADPFGIGEDAAAVMQSLAANPVALAQAQMKLWEGYMNLWTSAARRAAGEDAEPAVAPAKGDKRWRAEEWSDNPVLDVVKQSYLLTAKWLVDTVNSVEGVDETVKKRVGFFTQQLADAFSPTNFALTNPEVIKEALDTGGESFARGLANLAEDLERGKGRLSIRQSQYERFEVGENVASAPGQVVFQNDLIQLIQYAPSTAEVYERPLLIYPPWINKFYILDLREENSMIRWLTSKGYTVFLTSWVNPTAALASRTFEDYMRDGVLAALNATLEQSGADKVNTVGYCIGGTLLHTALAWMAQEKDHRIASATYFASQADFKEAGELLMFVTDDWIDEIERRMDAGGGVLDGQTMADTFNMLRSNDLVWSFVVNNYLMGKAPKAFDLLFWNADQTRLPKTMHLFYLRKFYRENALSEGTLEIGGRTLALSDIVTPSYYQASREDHIVPFGSVYRTASRISGAARYTLSGSGHIAGVINHPDAKKYQHWTNPVSPLPPSVEEWLEGATEHPGSWWQDWHKWLSRKSGAKVEARDPAAGPLKAIEPAPGSYVKVRS